MTYIVRHGSTDTYYGPFTTYEAAVAMQESLKDGGWNTAMIVTLSTVGLDVLARHFLLNTAKVVLDSSGKPQVHVQKIQAIRGLRQATNCGLREAKEAVDGWVLDNEGIRTKAEHDSEQALEALRAGLGCQVDIETLPVDFSQTTNLVVNTASGSTYDLLNGHLTVTRTPGHYLGSYSHCIDVTVGDVRDGKVVFHKDGVPYLTTSKVMSVQVDHRGDVRHALQK